MLYYTCSRIRGHLPDAISLRAEYTVRVYSPDDTVDMRQSKRTGAF